MKGELEFLSVGRDFAGRPRFRVALDDFDLSCTPGTATCVVGPNGAGKSTVLALAAGLISPSRGRVVFSGREIGPGSPPGELGYLAQRSRYPLMLRVEEIVAFVSRARGASRDDRDEIVAVASLDEVLGAQVGTLSSGWVRRLGLAVALMKPARLLLLDEPFVGLDLEVLERSLSLLRTRIDSGATALLSSHEFETLDRLRPRLAVLDQGRLLAVEEAPMSCRSTYTRVLRGEPQAGGKARLRAAAQT